MKKTWKRSLLGSTQLEVRLLREQRGKVRFAQGLHQKAQQRHQTRLWGCQTISDHVRLSMPCFSGLSQLIPWKTTISWPWPHWRSQSRPHPAAVASRCSALQPGLSRLEKHHRLIGTASDLSDVCHILEPPPMHLLQKTSKNKVCSFMF